jgi:hypothetical protein
MCFRGLPVRLLEKGSLPCQVSDTHYQAAILFLPELPDAIHIPYPHHRKKSAPFRKDKYCRVSCIVSGIHDLLCIDYNAVVIELEDVASAEIYEYAKTFLTDRSALQDGFNSVPSTPAGGKGRRFCPPCGVQLKPGIKFCNSCNKCGAKIS